MDIPDNAPERAAGSGSRDYFVWQPAGGSISILLSRHVVGLLQREVMKGFHALRKRGAEVGGLLLGRVKHNGRPTVLIERLEPVPCEYRFGPSYRLSEEDRARLEQAISRAKAAPQRLTVVGLYRSNTRPEMRLDQADLDLIQSLFADPEDVILLVQPISASQCSGTFFCWKDSGLSPEPSEEPFPFGVAEMPFSAGPAEPAEFTAEEPVEVGAETGEAGEEPAPVSAPSFQNEQLTPPTGRVTHKRWSWAVVAVLSVMVAALSIFLNRASKQAGLDNNRQPEIKAPAPEIKAPAPEIKAPPPAPAEEPKPRVHVRVPAKVLRQVLPTISPSIRARLQSDTRVDIRVRIDASGRVTSATPLTRGGSLYRYLAIRSAAAARQWRYEPATENGRAVATTEILHFTFHR